MAKDFKISAIFTVVDKATESIQKIHNKMGALEKHTKTFNKLNASVGKITGSLTRLGLVGFGAVTVAAYGTARAIRTIASAGMELESIEAGFKSMVGGADRAHKLMVMLKDAAAATPFELEGLAKVASSTLPIMNGNIEKTVKTMMMLSDVSRGSQDILERVAKGYTKAALKQKVDMESLNIILESGANIFEDLIDVMGVKSRTAFFKMVSAGKVSFSMLERAFERITGKGGMFYKGAVNLMDTVRGKLSTLYTEVKWGVSLIWQGVAPSLKDLIDRIIAVTKEFQGWVEVNKDFIKLRLVEFIGRAGEKFDDLVASVKAMNKEKPILDRIVETIESIGRVIAWIWDNRKTLAVVIGSLYAINFLLSVTASILGIMAALGLASGVTLWAIAIEAVIVLVGVLYVKFEWVRDIVNSIFNNVFFGFFTGMKLRDPAKEVFTDRETGRILGNLDKVDSKWRGLGRSTKVVRKMEESSDKYVNKAEKSIGSSGVLGTLLGMFMTNPAGMIRASLSTPTSLGSVIRSPETRMTERYESINSSNVVIRIEDETGRAKVDESRSKYRGAMIELARSGAF